MIFGFQNLREHDISKEGILYLLYSFVLAFTSIFFTIGQEQTSLLNYCISTQRRPHARSLAVPRALLSVTNNYPFYHKQSLHSQNNRCTVKTIAAELKQ